MKNKKIKKVLVLENSYYFKSGQKVSGFQIPGGIEVEGKFLCEENYIHEELTKEDIEKVKKIIDKKLELMFWRLYTRSDFVLQ